MTNSVDTEPLPDRADLVVIGGGLAGLTVAARVARAGRQVVVCERSSELGGRARTRHEAGFDINLGPHALYVDGATARTLAELGVERPGGAPPTRGALALEGHDLHPLPTGPLSLITTGLLTPAEKLAMARALLRLRRMDPEPHDRTRWGDLLGSLTDRPRVRALLRALARLSTYSDDLDQSAGVVIRQLRMATGSGVLYVDGGWATLIQGLRRLAAGSGARIATGARVAKVLHDGSVHTVVLGDDRRIETGAAVLAVPPGDASRLPEPALPSLQAAARRARPVPLATLDLGLDRLPVPDRTLVLGVTEPLYFSVHSASARLAPPDGAMVHACKYVNGETDPDADLADIERFLDRVQPGWRDRVVVRQYLPRIGVSTARASAATGGPGGRPGPEVPEVEGLYLAGDWVGPEGLLSDAATASAGAAAESILARETPNRRRVSHATSD